MVNGQAGHTPPRLIAGFPAPERLEARAVPPKDGIRLNNAGRTEQARPELGCHHSRRRYPATPAGAGRRPRLPQRPASGQQGPRHRRCFPPWRWGLAVLQQAARRRGRYSSLHERSLTTASRCIRDNFDWLQRSYRSEAQTIASGAIPWADGKLVHDRLGATGRMAGTSQYFAASNDTRAHGALSLLMLSSVEEALTVARLMREAGPPTSLTKRKRGREATLNAWRNETTTARFNGSFEHALGGRPADRPCSGPFHVRQPVL